MNNYLFAALSCFEFIFIVGGLLMIAFHKKLKAFEARTARRFRAWKRKVRRNICVRLMQKDGVIIEPVYYSPNKVYVENLVKLIREET